MQIDNKFLQQICDTMRDNDSYFMDLNALYNVFYDTYDINKLMGHLHILKDEGCIEVLCDSPFGFMRLTSKGYGLCSCIKCCK